MSSIILKQKREMRGIASLTEVANNTLHVEYLMFAFWCAFDLSTPSRAGVDGVLLTSCISAKDERKQSLHSPRC